MASEPQEENASRADGANMHTSDGGESLVMTSGGGRWNWIATQPLAVQIIGGLIVIGAAAALSFMFSLILPSSCVPGSKPEGEEKVKLESILPDSPLGEKLLFFIVKAAAADQMRSVQSIQGHDLEVRVGRITVNEERTVVSQLGVYKKSNGEELIAGRNLPVAGGWVPVASRLAINCNFRLDVMTTKELFLEEKFIISLESWGREKDQPCLVKTGGDRVWKDNNLSEEGAE